MTADELFVCCGPARQGITITNDSEYEDMVMLKHFGPRA